MSILELLENKNETGLKLYVDLDGVLTDWQAAWHALGQSKGLDGEDFEKKFGAETMWGIINKAGIDFWSDMPWTKDGKQLWNYIKKFNPTILTTPAKSKSSKEGKEIWIKRELGINIPFILEKNKYIYATPDSVLIDDFINKIQDWVNQGDGIGIIHKNAESTIKQLKQMGL